jgi:hypothetical protein
VLVPAEPAAVGERVLDPGQVLVDAAHHVVAAGQEAGESGSAKTMACSGVIENVRAVASYST